MPRTKSALRWCAQQLCCPFVVNRLLPARRCEILISNPGLITSFKRWVISDISQIHSHRTASHLGTRFMNLISGHCKLQQHVMGHDMSRYVMVSHNAPILQESNHTKPAGIKGTRSLSHVRVVDCQEFLENFWRSIERGGLLNLKSQARTVASHPQFKLHHPNPTFAASLDATPSNLPQATGCCRSTSRTC